MLDSGPSSHPTPLALACGHPAMARLTLAERQVAEQILEGLTNKEIALVLNKAPQTVKVQVGGVLRKFGVPNRLRFLAEYYKAQVPLPAMDGAGDEKVQLPAG